MTAQLAQRLPSNFLPADQISLVWLAFSLSVTASVVPEFTGAPPAPLSYIATVVGSGACGWLWLLSRCLFRAEKSAERWTLYLVAAIIAVEASYSLVARVPAGGLMAEVQRVLGNAEGFVCVGALVLVFAEVFSGYGRNLSRPERRFRLVFGLTFGALTAVTILWVLNADANSLGGQLRAPITLLSASAAIIGTRYCLAFRKANPLSVPKKAKTTTPVARDDALAKRIVSALQQDRNYATPELKVADLAALLGEQEYKVTQCITGTLGFRNFNQLINSHRIASAKAALADPANSDRPILSVAFDCGFNSVGPFNRAFKQHVGMTPREYRAACD